MNATKALQNWIAQLDRRIYAILIGLAIGISGGLMGLGIATIGPLYTLIVAVALLVGLYLLTDVRAALYIAMTILFLLPFGTLPFKIGFTPTLLDLSLGAFVMVYLILWMTGRRRNIQLTPPHLFVTLYIMWLIFAFMVGLRYGMPDSNTLRQFAETLLSIGMVYILVDYLREPRTLRQLVLVILVLVSAQAFIAIGLYLLNDATANSILIRLERFGYPGGNVIRYIESDPALGERAIGTWVDPNTLGGLLATSAALFAPQVFARRPVLRNRWVTMGALLLVGLALVLSSSRASFLAFGAGLTVIAFIRYRRFLPLLALAAASLLLLPQTQNYVDRIFQAFQGADLATQMRIGEWTDSLELISQYPAVGIGFTGTPTAAVYTDVANMYLIMANKIGLIGVFFFLLAMAAVFRYGYKAWHYARNNPELESIHLGYHIALFTALVNAVADLYFFRQDFQASITWFWLIIALCLASSRLVLQQKEKFTTLDTTIRD
ncbi:O-antigen ligase family protein [Phototrophicus methaneseepsis]|uniref:O-antigen ligase family protein n=1 Tax=Phototrophicus methaneseepsis TaxID=2710758 RepID=A0A7S8E5T8_9CHLR|nr:O-antigen ligase family protein [Phototrophicus methaneseepsis]QPC80875.1 O-antigen ligase family protein [Phototrophicus methaneseepsis]